MRRHLRGATVWRIGLHGAALVALLAVLWRAAPFLKLLAVAAVIAAALESLVAWFVGKGWRRGLAIAVAVAAALAIWAGAFAVLIPRVGPQLQRAADALPDVMSTVRNTAAYDWLQDHAVVGRALQQARQYVGTAIESILSGAIWLVGFVADVVTVIGVTIFLLASGPSAWGWVVKWAPPAKRPRIRSVAADARRAVAGYVAGALIVGAVAGVVTAVTTGLLGVEYFLALAVVTGALGVIPFIGAIISGLLVVLVTWMTVGTTAALIALAVFIAYQEAEALVLQPMIQRHTISINPLVVLVAVLFGMAAAGVFGAVVALPIAAAGRVVAEDALARRRRAWRAARDAVAPSRVGEHASGAPAEARH